MSQLNFLSSIETKTVTVISENITWDSNISYTNGSGWVELTSNPVGGVGNTIVGIKVNSVNTSSQERVANIRFKEDVAGTTYIRDVQITQNGTNSNCETYLSNIAYDANQTSIECCGPIRYDQTIDGVNRKLKIGGVEFNKGIGTHANSTIVYHLNGQYSNFTASIGRDDEADGCGCDGNSNIRFSVKVRDCASCGDYDPASGLVEHNMNPSNGPQFISVNVTGKQYLVLKTEKYEEFWGDHADWADAKVTCTGGCSVSPPSLSASPNTIQQGQSSTLSGSCSQGTLTWSNFPGNPVTPNQTTTYYATCVNGSCTSSPSSVQVTVTTGGGCTSHGFVGLPIAPYEQDYLSPRLDRSIDNNILEVNDVTFSNGIGTHANSYMTYAVPSGATHFKSKVGRDDESDGCGCGNDYDTRVKFIVKVKDCQYCSEYDPSSGVFSIDKDRYDAASDISVNITGKAFVVLRTQKYGENWGDHADWIQARFETCNNNNMRVGENQNNIEPTENVETLAIYPNPTNEKIEVKFYLKESTIIPFDIVDAGGKLLKQISLEGKIGENEHIIELSKIPEGIYFLKTIINNKPESKRFIIER